MSPLLHLVATESAALLGSCLCIKQSVPLPLMQAVGLSTRTRPPAYLSFTVCAPSEALLVVVVHRSERVAGWVTPRASATPAHKRCLPTDMRHGHTRALSEKTTLHAMLREIYSFKNSVSNMSSHISGRSSLWQITILLKRVFF